MTEMTVKLCPQDEAYIQQQVVAGAYATPAELIRDALHYLREGQKSQEQKLDWLRHAIEEAEASGESLDAAEVFEELRRAYGIGAAGP